jgi:HD-GYP domain-containing protein (c-di-GMP phosphodiesterase class II)
VLPENTEFGERELRLLGGLAHQARLAIANASSFEGLQHAFVSTVEALANALEANDEYTSTHARYITDLALGVGRELALDEATLKRLELGALLHDIGKIGIPSDILRKPGRLTAEERTVMETHPTLGERIIAPIDRLQEVRSIVRHCHERWDGRGYPDQFAAEEIPLESRIIFVCDAYHAMTSDRPYRRRLTPHVAQRRLAEGAGTQFDPQVVEACLRVLSAHG